MKIGGNGGAISSGVVPKGNGTVLVDSHVTDNGTTVTVTGAAAVTGDFAIATSKFTVASASGNTVVAGTLGATGNFAVATNKFTVAAATGNTLVAGALAHTGATLGFYSTPAIALQTGVAVSAAGIHAALVALGLITA